MVPRAYQYQSQKPLHASNINDKNAVAIAVRERSPVPSKRKDKPSGNGKPAWLSSSATSSPSKPVIIPTRTRTGGARKAREALVKTKKPLEDHNCHDPDSVPSSVAALLAMTSVPELRCQSKGLKGPRPRYAPKIKKKEDTSQGAPGHSMSSSSPQSWDMLLSPPDEPDLEHSSYGSDTTLDVSFLDRSLSVDSMPSLDEDSGSLTSPSISLPSTPKLSTRSRNGHERRTKELSPLKSEDCILDHPLLPPSSVDKPISEDDAEVQVSRHRGFSRSTSALKSNLSASIARIRSAARSFTNFTAPAISRDEYLTRSLLSISPPFTDERRPSPTQGPPDPALRRYLNPTNFSPSELHIHHDHPQSPSNRDRCTASIQLQSYKRVPRSFDKASAPPIFTSSKEKADAAMVAAAEEPFITPYPRQREPRENSDFLRVIVLEMNMRRSGQLGDSMPGKARMSLPARQPCKKAEAEDVEAVEGRVPKRWVAVGAY
ncbi:MAG: hypothetical protein Q9195_007389 [Heterodermia aff. obscurata]